MSSALAAMAKRSRTLASVRELLDTAERLDIDFTGGALLHEEEVSLYTNSLLQAIRAEFQEGVEVERSEETTCGVILSVLPGARTAGVYQFCKDCTDLVKEARYDVIAGTITVTYNLRPPVHFCWTSFVAFVAFAAAIACYYAASLSVPVETLIATLY